MNPSPSSPLTLCSLSKQATEGIIVDFFNTHGLASYIIGSSDSSLGPSPPLGFVNWFEGFGYVWYMDLVASYRQPAPSLSELDFYVGDSNSTLASLYRSTLLPAVRDSNIKLSNLYSLQVDVNPTPGGGIPLPMA